MTFADLVFAIDMYRLYRILFASLVRSPDLDHYINVLQDEFCSKFAKFVEFVCKALQICTMLSLALVLIEVSVGVLSYSVAHDAEAALLSSHTALSHKSWRMHPRL